MRSAPALNFSFASFEENIPPLLMSGIVPFVF
jgi:hypothetical protein